MVRQRIFGATLALAAAAFGAFIANSYISRLPDHRGLFLVHVEDTVNVPLPAPPRHTVVIVIDGLRKDGAERLQAARLIAAHGQCFTTDVGQLSVSRPVYAELSTGLEQDRTGSRNNDETSPLQVPSLWESARTAGRSVAAVSELPWWRELFPRGFDRYEMPPRESDYFARELAADLTLIHPIYVDETAHEHGGVSPEYTEAVDRVDREVSPLVRTIDWQQDLVLFTADHGHRARGGHGAPAPDIEFVLTCVAGRGVTPSLIRGAIDTKTLGPLLTVLLGIPFPGAMRAGDDELDQIWAVASSLPADYLADRRSAVAKFRAANAAALKEWGVASGRWPAFYRAQHSRQSYEWLVALLAPIAILRWQRRSLLRCLLWVGAVCVAMIGFEIAIRGSFDFNAINQRYPFVAGTLVASVLAILAGATVLRRLSRVTVRDAQSVLVASLVWTNVGHILIHGWPIGFPLPSPVVFFLPFANGIFLLVSGLFLALLFLRRGL